MPSHAGLSRIEVLVIVLIGAIVTGLVAVGVVRIREESARVSCSNNLRQLALGVHNYHDANNCLPPLVDQGEGAPTGRGRPSVFALLNPYLEQDPWNYYEGRRPTEYHAHSSIPFPFQHKDGTPGTLYGEIANQFRRTFVYPADTTADKLRDIPMSLPDGTTGYYATGSYAANGLLPWGSKGFRDGFPNGTENTILIAERPQVCRDAAGNTTYNLWGVGFYSPHMPAFAVLTPADPPGLLSTGQVVPVLPLPADRDAAIPVRVGRRDANPQPPDFPTPIQILAKNKPCDPRVPGSPHRAGMQVVMADGSVRVFAPDTAARVFWSACAPGGEVCDR